MLSKIYICREFEDKQFLFLGSGPNRGQSLVELGEIPYVCTYIHPSYQGRYPASQRKILADKEKQAKGIADHLTPLGDWLDIYMFSHPK